MDKDYKIERINVPNKLSLVNLKNYLADYKSPTQISNAEPIQTDSPNQVLYSVVGLNNTNKSEVEREIKKLFNEYICEQINCDEINGNEKIEPFVHDDNDDDNNDIDDDDGDVKYNDHFYSTTLIDRLKNKEIGDKKTGGRTRRKSKKPKKKKKSRRKSRKIKRKSKKRR